MLMELGQNRLWHTCTGKKQVISVWKGIAQDALIMNIDDLLCVGATDNILLSSTIGEIKPHNRRSTFGHYKRNRRADKELILV
jgi:hypothetical protein